MVTTTVTVKHKKAALQTVKELVFAADARGTAVKLSTLFSLIAGGLADADVNVEVAGDTAEVLRAGAAGAQEHAKASALKKKELEAAFL